MTEQKPRRVPSMRPSMVDGGWDEIPDAVPEDTNFTATVDSKELTSPDPSKRPLLEVNRDDEATTQEDRSALGLPPAAAEGVQHPPQSSTMLGPPPAPPHRVPMPSTPPPPPVRKPQRSFPAPPPPPQRAQPSSPAPASSRPSHPPPSHRPPPPSHRPPPPSHRPPPPSHRPPPPPSRPEVRAPLPSVPILPDDHVPSPPQIPRDPNTISESLSDLLDTAEASAPPPIAEFTPPPPQRAPPPDLGAPTPPSSRAPASMAPASVAVAGLPSVKEALNLRVRVGEGAGPLWGFLLLGFGGAAILIAIFVFLFGVLAGSAGGSDEAKPIASNAPSSQEKPTKESAKPAPAPSPQPAPEPEPPPPEPMPKDAVERAARGDEKALADLEARPQGSLSVTEALAVAAGHAAVKRRAVQELGARARKEPAFAGSDEIARELKRAASDPGTMPDALRVMAELPDPQGADMLYDVYTSKKKGDPTGDLARMLLFSAGVRKRASPALAVALDLRTLEKCDQVLAAVKLAEQKGDKRSTSALFRFNQKKGCGDDKKADCWPCLRDGDELKDAIRAVAKRKPSR